MRDSNTKNNDGMFDFLAKYGNLDKAISNARKLYESYEDKTPSKMQPARKLYELIELLKPHFEQ